MRNSVAPGTVSFTDMDYQLPEVLKRRLQLRQVVRASAGRRRVYSCSGAHSDERSALALVAPNFSGGAGATHAPF